MAAFEKSKIVKLIIKLRKIKKNKKDKVYQNKLLILEVFWKETITNCINMCKYCWKQIYVGGKIFWFVEEY